MSKELLEQYKLRFNSNAEDFDSLMMGMLINQEVLLTSIDKAYDLLLIINRLTKHPEGSDLLQHINDETNRAIKALTLDVSKFKPPL